MHLHNWIDLIWGYKQRGKQAADNYNLFFHLTYEGSVDLENMSDPVMRRAMKEQIANFGQIPIQLFDNAHPQRKPSKLMISPNIFSKYQERFDHVPYLHVVKMCETSITKIIIFEELSKNYDILCCVGLSGDTCCHTLFMEDTHILNQQSINNDDEGWKIPASIRNRYTYRSVPEHYCMSPFVLFESLDIYLYYINIVIILFRFSSYNK